jgi:hypothetical protein
MRLSFARSTYIVGVDIIMTVKITASHVKTIVRVVMQLLVIVIYVTILVWNS